MEGQEKEPQEGSGRARVRISYLRLENESNGNSLRDNSEKDSLVTWYPRLIKKVIHSRMEQSLS